MARKRSRPVEDFGGVPGPLADPSPDFWADDAAVLQLAAQCGLSAEAVALSKTVTSTFPASTWPWERFKAFRDAWAARWQVESPRGAGVYQGRDIHAGFPSTQRERLRSAAYGG